MLCDIQLHKLVLVHTILPSYLASCVLASPFSRRKSAALAAPPVPIFSLPKKKCTCIARVFPPIQCSPSSNPAILGSAGAIGESLGLQALAFP
ncbi:hypothetical protein FH972_010701 [Carpinus fangiana]|uniref:Uncharacterized protein n=1 Tax=Carpinus fangiana TaxID=176857 RepID=A0A660KS75_9ROSI|nr:hypothetical protein FH972_010701 [Carpinus fangiana]